MCDGTSAVGESRHRIPRRIRCSTDLDGVTPRWLWRGVSRVSPPSPTSRLGRTVDEVATRHRGGRRMGASRSCATAAAAGGIARRQLRESGTCRRRGACSCPVDLQQRQGGQGEYFARCRHAGGGRRGGGRAWIDELGGETQETPRHTHRGVRSWRRPTPHSKAHPLLNRP